MGIPFAKIEELIEVCKQVDEKEYEDDWDKRIHVRDIGATLQKLIDDELAELDKMANEFIEQENIPVYDDWPEGQKPTD
tara:strand:- start:3363 stop:3599 length:237 start_codon:yes stop_codon:yes gene_type:complete